MKRIISSIILSLLFVHIICAQNSIDLSGKWNFQIDRQDAGVVEQWFRNRLKEEINLPGSMPEKLKGDDISVRTKWTGSLYDSSYYYNPYMAKYRIDGKVKLPFFLTPDKHYVGVAWYQKEVSIPSSWKGERIVLSLERPHIETTVWVNDKKVGMQNSLCVPHEYDLTSYIRPGKCKISIRVDNRLKEINVGPDSHSVTDQTQGNWNGIVGKMTLTAGSTIHFDDIQVFPDLANKKALVKILLKSDKLRNVSAKVILSAQSFNSERTHTALPVSKNILIKGDSLSLEMDLPMGDGMLTWDEFDPALYKLKAKIVYGNKSEEKEVQFGMRDFTIKGKWFYVNGNKTVLRGTVENCDFPLTGYAPMQIEDWERVFRICKNYGLNHMRFHSFCPPTAAFEAADLVGFYLQPEGPSWPNHGPKLGMGQPIDKYLMDETIRISKEYGNYASFCMLACGNEPSGRWVAWVSKFVDYWKAKDSRRVYTGASVGGSWQWQPKSQYHVKAGARGLDWANSMPESMSDYHAKIDTVSQPYVSHETGQWCAFPDFNEIRKYTGVNKARNFEIFKDLLEAGNMGNMGHNFMMASGKLQALCYKNEIEKTLRTPDYAGFQLLSLNDYSGQGTALVGLLNVFWEEKGYINAPEFRRFCSPTVPLARIQKFVYKNNETFQADIEIILLECIDREIDNGSGIAHTENIGVSILSGAVAKRCISVRTKKWRFDITKPCGRSVCIDAIVDKIAVDARKSDIGAQFYFFGKLYVGIEAHIVAAKARFVSHTGIVGVAKGKIIEGFFVASGDIDIVILCQCGTIYFVRPTGIVMIHFVIGTGRIVVEKRQLIGFSRRHSGSAKHFGQVSTILSGI